MTPSYEYSPYIWPMLTAAGLGAALVVYSWRHRNALGAFPLSFWCGDNPIGFMSGNAAGTQ